MRGLWRSDLRGEAAAESEMRRRCGGGERRRRRRRQNRERKAFLCGVFREAETGRGQILVFHRQQLIHRQIKLRTTTMNDATMDGEPEAVTTSSTARCPSLRGSISARLLLSAALRGSVSVSGSRFPLPKIQRTASVRSSSFYSLLFHA
ncbi:hypothetical protein Droror1_Dr00001326 [Drosera rotundifolia]